MKTNNIPVGSAVLGRVINSNGKPIDHKGDLDHPTYLPLYTPDALNPDAHSTPIRLLETGIKMIDLLAPIAYGSVVGMIAGLKLGKDALMEELMLNLTTQHQAVIVIASMSQAIYNTSPLRDIVRDIEAENHIAMLFEQVNDELAARQKLLYAAMTIAQYFHDKGQEILLVLDDHLITPENATDVQHFASAKGITTIRFTPVGEAILPVSKDILDALDVQFWFSQERANHQLWPALDPLASHSRLLDNDQINTEHRLVASRVHDTLQHYYELRERAKSESLSAEDQILLTRGEKLDLFCTQPFTIAEAYTDIPGTYLTIEETISSFHNLLDGDYDAVPTASFRFVGKLERL